MLSITAVLAAASVVGAIPTPQDHAVSDFAYVIDPWTSDPPQKRELSGSVEIQQRDAPSTIAGYDGLIPGCDVDPSFEMTKNTAYTVNQGVKVPKNGDNDQCTTGSLGNHCWTEYYLVETAIEYQNWRQQGGGVDCATTSVCDSTHTVSNQTCTTVGSTITDGWDVKIFEGSFSAEFDLKLVKSTWGGSSSTNINKQTANTDLTAVCVVNQDANACHWDDKKCHQLWEADRVLHIWGQSQRVCNGKGNNVQQNTQRDDGKWVRGQHGFDFMMPINSLQGCGALCTDTEYKQALPSNAARQPFKKPEGW